MNNLENLLADTLTHRAEQAPRGPVDLDRRSRRPGTTAAVLVGCLAAVLVAILAIAVSSSTSPHKASDRRDSASPALSTPALPKGERLAAYGPVSLLVPTRLPTRISLCGKAVANQVIAQTTVGETIGCLPPGNTMQLATNPGTVIWFSTAMQYTPYQSIPTTRVTVDGHPARRGYTDHAAHLGSGYSGVIHLLDSGITIGVSAPTRKELAALLASVDVSPVNRAGCAATYNAATQTRAGPASKLIPSGAVATVRCVYDTSFARGAFVLVATDVLGQTDTTTLTRALNALEPDPCHCVHGGTASPRHGEVLYIRYRNGTKQRVTGTIGSNLDTWTNRKRTVANYSSSITGLLDKLTNS